MFTCLCLKHSRTCRSLIRVLYPRINCVCSLKSVHIKLRDNEPLLLHHVIADHEPGPEAAVPARLQRRAEPHCEEFGYWHSVRQLRVFGLRLQQFQLSRLQLSLRTGAGTSTDITVFFVQRYTQASISSHSARVFVFRRSLCLVWSWLWCAMCLKCFTSSLTWMSPGTHALFYTHIYMYIILHIYCIMIFFFFFNNFQDHASCEESAASHSNGPGGAGCP